IGRYLIPVLYDHYKNLFLTYHDLAPVALGKTIQIDLTKLDQVRTMINKLKPDIIINLAAKTDVDRCETERDSTMLVNQGLVSVISEYAASNQSVYLLHMSTDYIFDGQTGNYKEEDSTNPINWYGKTKLEAERQIIDKVEPSRWCIARTSTPFGFHPIKKSFPVFVLNKLRHGELINAITDQFTSPTYAGNLAHMLREIVARRIVGKIHVASKSRISRYQQAVKIARVFGLDEKSVCKKLMHDIKWNAKRPSDSSLNVERATTLLEYKPKTFDYELFEFSKENPLR
ncbi:MAG: SDR family oxidoreductase, partial [Nitrososphaeraceae archaeon]